MHAYRTHDCGALRAPDEGLEVRLSGWVHSKRDHGGLLFIDLRDHYGLTQIVFPAGSAAFGVAEGVRPESVITVTGAVVRRVAETVNPRLPTGEVEVRAAAVVVQSAAEVLPIQVAGDQVFPEELRLRYRFIDLRREKLQRNMILRSRVIDDIRRRMIAAGFNEFQTPILTVSSPEGARDFLVPARLHPGKFYALPQAPQQYKQLTMVAGFDRYFQIAPCFRDEAGRADRTLMFYQLDVEMSFVTQEDVFATMEPVVHGAFDAFADGRALDAMPFRRIPHDEAMLRYGTDKPDLRNPLQITDVTAAFAGSGFGLFAKIAAAGGVVRAIPAPGAAGRPRAFFDRLNVWAREQGAGGLGYIAWDVEGPKGPIAKNLDPARVAEVAAACGLQAGDAVFFAAGKVEEAAKFAGQVRLRLGTELELVEKDAFRFCWITDFPMYERDEGTGTIDFAHNPFSMPRGGLEGLDTDDLLSVKANQYDVVCNGYELASGAIRNHKAEIMIAAFGKVGYPAEVVEERFGGMLNAFRYGAPPHGGMAAGIDRIVMLLADEPNLREVNLFPMNQQGEELMMGSPSAVDAIRLEELSVKVDIKPPAPKAAKAETPKAG